MKLKSTQLPFLLMLMGSTVLAQLAPPVDIATHHIRTNLDAWGLTSQDMEGMTVSDIYTDKKTGITRAFMLQRHQGIPVFGGITTVNINKAGEVFFATNHFFPNLAPRLNTTLPILSAEEAVKKLMAHLGLPGSPRLVEQDGDESFVFGKGDIAKKDISAKLSIQPMKGHARLAWDIFLAPATNDDTWSTRVDAVTGDILDEQNLTLRCKVDGKAFARAEHDCHSHEAETKGFMEKTFSAMVAGGGTYGVVPAPFESPNHGPHQLVEDPADSLASPYGWHDVNGMDGAEFTITRGNNAHAYQDRDNNNTSMGDEPDGGADLLFDFPYTGTLEPGQMIEAATVNLFYWVNFMHDFSYRFGFDEPAGNYQVNNYGNGGIGGDLMIAEAQAGAETGLANNAISFPSNDGSSGLIRMYVWQNSGAEYLTVNEPASISGTYPTILPGATGWATGAYVTDVPVTAEGVFVDDGFGSPTDGCQVLVNSADVAGKIALIDRGSCNFSRKAFNAQEAGAIGVVICNIPGATALGAMGNGGMEVINIPLVLISVEDCATIRQFVGNGLNLSLVFPDPVVPQQLDGDFDNGIIAHEYFHGVSNRLTGGPNQLCMGDPAASEHMGEGWSDFASLITTVRPGDTGDMARGTGTFATREPVNGPGIRNFPYSTDMDINPLTYGDLVTNTEEHARGEIWTAMIWDMYWALSDKYGWSENPYDETSGNYKAIHLVFEGMKNQGCFPGFETGRNAIMAAEKELYGEVDRCLLWEVFARRGMGIGAMQNNPGDNTDGVENFDIPCDCRNKITITKSVTDFIEPGDQIQVTINLSNCKTGPVTGVVVTDEIPDGTEFKVGSSNVPATVLGNMVEFDLGALAFEDVEVITYTLTTDPDKSSTRFWLDEVVDANAFDNWDFELVIGDYLWLITDQFGGHTGDYAWFAEDPAAETEQIMFLKPDLAWTVTGDRPALRIYHQHNTEPRLDGGLVEVKTVGSTLWHQVNDLVLRNKYDNILPYGTLALPNIGVWSGYSGDEFEASYIDLSPWIGDTIQIRFRFASDAMVGVPGDGWQVDDIEFMDLYSYTSEACFSTDQGDSDCYRTIEEGTIVNSSETNSTVETLKDVTITTYPNPVDNVLNVAINSERQQDLQLSLLTVDGKVISTQSFNIYGNQNIQLNVSSIPAGFYFLKVSSDEGMVVQKVVVE